MVERTQSQFLTMAILVPGLNRAENLLIELKQIMNKKKHSALQELDSFTIEEKSKQFSSEVL